MNDGVDQRAVIVDVVFFSFYTGQACGNFFLLKTAPDIHVSVRVVVCMSRLNRVIIIGNVGRLGRDGGAYHLRVAAYHFLKAVTNEFFERFFSVLVYNEYLVLCRVVNRHVVAA